MDSISSGRQSTLDYGLLLRRRWWVVVCGVLAGLAFAYTYVDLSPKTYRSTAMVLVKPTQADLGAVAGGRTSAPINLDTESQLVRSVVVATRAQKLLRSAQSPAELVDQVQVSVPANTSVLAISYETSTATGALQGAHSFAEAYLQNRLEAAKAEVGVQVKSLKAQLGERQKELEDWTGKAASLPATSSEAAYAGAQERVILDQISELNRRLSPLQTADLNPGRIITDAQLPATPSAPIPLLYLASGVMAGLLFGLIIAVMRERLDRRVLRAEDLEHDFDLPVLAKLRGGPRRDAGSAVPSPDSPDGQELHQLCHVLIARLGPLGGVVLVTGASSGGGTGLVAAGLATALTRRGSTVALVCADANSPSASWFRAGHGRRMSGQADLPQLRVIAAGTSGDDLSQMLRRGATAEFFSTLRESVRYVVVEAPPISVAVETLTLAEYADIALIATEIPRASRNEIKESIRRLGREGLDIAGAAVVPSRVAKRHLRRASETREDRAQALPPLTQEPVPAVSNGAVALNVAGELNGMSAATPTVSTSDAVTERA